MEKLLKEFGHIALCWQCVQPVDPEGGRIGVLLKCQKCKSNLIYIVSLEKYEEILKKKREGIEKKEKEDEARERLNWRTPWRLGRL